MAKEKKNNKKNKQPKSQVEKMLRPYIKHVLGVLLTGGLLLGGTAVIGDSEKANELIDCNGAIEKAIDEQVASAERLRFTGPEEAACGLTEKTDGIPLKR